jgi:hypothetical protein
MQAGGAEQTEDETPRFRNRLAGSVSHDEHQTLGTDDTRASEMRTASRLLTHGEARARPRPRVTLVRRTNQARHGL